MSRFTWLFRVFPFVVGILTGCTSLVTSFNRIHASMTKQETPEESHNYGAFFRASRSLNTELPTQWSALNLRRGTPPFSDATSQLLNCHSASRDQALPSSGE
jgi:hypothetical protein